MATTWEGRSTDMGSTDQWTSQVKVWAPVAMHPDGKPVGPSPTESRDSGCVNMVVTFEQFCRAMGEHPPCFYAMQIGLWNAVPGDLGGYDVFDQGWGASDRPSKEQQRQTGQAW